ncbi:glycosyltransferase family 4 protein [Zobellia roscoffensis]|uniref:glycosyltransferase family 4 protein n=1 Tax=Zobellia roscoffensis TaxID=2779508 RepID=UPI00188AE7DE|nr:glycosyltransferase [Zobellia roscoffensis]
MRVLWFSNRPPLGASGSKNRVGGSWIESLEQEIMTNSDIELGIVFSELEKEPKEIDSDTSRTKYFMVPRYPYSKLDRWYSRFFATPPSEAGLKHYLDVVNDFNPDVILFFGTESDFPLIIPELKVPSIIWFQGNLTVYEIMYENGLKAKITLGLESFKRMLSGDTMYHNFLKFKHLVKREKRIFSFAQNFIGRTNWDSRLVKTMAPQAKYFHCDEAMRPPFLENQWKQWSDRGKFVITTTIRGNLYKGLETVFRTSAILSDKLGKRLEWRIIGIAEGTVYTKAARKEANFPLSRSEVKLLGNKTGPEMIEELLNSDIYVHPSHIENSPNGVQEAMLLGMPVIATNVGGTPSMLVDGVEGLLVQSKDPYAMAGAILEFSESPSKAKAMGDNARKLGLVRNDSKKICDDLLNIFDELTQSNN